MKFPNASGLVGTGRFVPVRQLVRISHVIAGLSTGGAEMMLYKLLSRMDRSKFESEVISLTDIGIVGEKIRSLGVPVRALGMRQGIPNPAGVARLGRWLRKERPDVVQTWMYHADLVGGIAAKLAGGIPVAWNIRHGYLEHGKRTTLWTAKACARLSGLLPDRILVNAELSRRAHVRLGYEAKKMIVIPNGFDLEVFAPDPAARLSVRRELGIPEGAPLIGSVARLDPAKDHRNLVRAAALLHARKPEVRFLLCGAGITPENREMAGWIEEAGVQDRCHLLGPREDVARLDAALDVATSSSSGEGFPNAVGEAMACGVPCVVTGAGDSAAIVGETGIVVPPRNPDALAAGWLCVLGMDAEERRALGQRARKRIEERYSLESVTAAYETLYAKLARA